MTRTASNASVRSNELRLAPRPEERVRPRHVVMPPACRGIASHDGYAISVVEELRKPGDMTQSPTEGRVHKYGALPITREPIHRLCVDASGGNPMRRTWRAGI